MARARGRVLIVEDAPALAETYAEYLKTENCTVEIVTNGASAVARLETSPPELLVLDEPFCTMDTSRRDLALRLLAHFHADTGWQIILLTKDAALPAAARAAGAPVTETALATPRPLGT